MITIDRVSTLASNEDEQYVLTPKPVIRVIPLLFGSIQIQSEMRPITFNAQDAGDFSKTEIITSWNRVLSTGAFGKGYLFQLFSYLWRTST